MVLSKWSPSRGGRSFCLRLQPGAVGLTSNMDVMLMTTLRHDLKRCSGPPPFPGRGFRGESFGLWLQPETKIYQIDIRPQERFRNKAQNQLVNLQKTLEICMCLFVPTLYTCVGFFAIQKNVKTNDLWQKLFVTDVFAFNLSSYLYYNQLSGTLPSAWSLMGFLFYL